MYLRAKYYDPSIGRFTQEDPYRGDGLNLYTYVSNYPVKYIDPTGLAKCAAAKNYDKALDGLHSVFSAIAIMPGLGSAISTPLTDTRDKASDIQNHLKAIFNAVGNASEITK